MGSCCRGDSVPQGAGPCGRLVVDMGRFFYSVSGWKSGPRAGFGEVRSPGAIPVGEWFREPKRKTRVVACREFSGTCGRYKARRLSWPWMQWTSFWAFPMISFSVFMCDDFLGNARHGETKASNRMAWLANERGGLGPLSLRKSSFSAGVETGAASAPGPGPTGDAAHAALTGATCTP